MKTATLQRAAKQRLHTIEDHVADMAARRNTAPEIALPADLTQETVGDLGDEYRPLMPIDLLHPSPTNPRKHFDPLALAELADSIRAKGVLEPIIVRPRPVVIARGPTKGLHEAYEIVAGERRWRAAREADCRAVPVLIRAYTDKQVMQVQLMENVQRQDLTPLEQADGYQLLLDQHGYTVETLAAELGKSKASVYTLLALRRLPKRALEAVADGVLSVTAAGLIARIPNDKLRQEAIAWFLYECCDGTGPSVREMKEMIQREWMMELKQAPFSLKDDSLLPSAGACSACPKRTGNARDLYPDARADVCTDPGCYHEKVKLHADRAHSAAVAKGLTVLPDKAAERLFSGTELGWEARKQYVDLDGVCDEDQKSRTYGKLLGDEVESVKLLARDRTGRMHTLVSTSDARPIVRKQLGKDVLKPARSGGDQSWKRSEAKRRAEAKLYKNVVQRIMADVAERIEKRHPLSPEALRALVGLLADHTWSDAVTEVAKRRGVDKPTEGEGRTRRLDGILPTLDAAGLMGLLAELITARTLSGFSSTWSTHKLDPQEQALFKALGVDVQRHVQAAKKEKASK